MKIVTAYYLNLFGKWSKWSSIFAGCAFFLTFIYHVVIESFLEYGILQLLHMVILPLLIFAAMFVLQRGFLLVTPKVYAILGAVFFLLIAVWSIPGGNMLYTCMSFVFYIALSALLILTAFGFIPRRAYITIAIGFALGYRLLVSDAALLQNFDIWMFMPEAALLFGLASQFCMTMAMKKYN